MSSIVKIGLLLAGAYASYKVTKMVSAGMVAMGMIIKITPETEVDIQGLTLITNIDISNPTDSSMILSSPLVQLFHKGENIASNEVSNKEFHIKAFSKTRLPIVLKLSWEQIKDLLISINFSFPESYSNFKKILWIYRNYAQLINKLGLVVKYSTYANGINYKDSQTIEI